MVSSRPQQHTTAFVTAPVAFLAAAGLGAFGLYLADRSDGLMLLAAYILWAIAGLIALVPSGILRHR